MYINVYTLHIPTQVLKNNLKLNCSPPLIKFALRGKRKTAEVHSESAQKAQ